MRSQALPPSNLTQKVYEEASYLSLDELANRLAPMRSIAGQEVKNCFFSSIPNYHQNYYKILDIGKRLAQENGGARKSKVSFLFILNALFQLCSKHYKLRYELPYSKIFPIRTTLTNAMSMSPLARGRVNPQSPTSCTV